jgi:hypothetical protein
MRGRRGVGNLGVRQFERERGDRDGDAKRGHGDRRTSANIYRSGERIHDHNGKYLALHVFLYTEPDNSGAQPEGCYRNMHFRRLNSGPDRKHRDMDDYHRERFERVDVHGAIPDKLPKTIRSGSDVHCDVGCGQG